MQIRSKIRHLPLRVAAGSYMLNSGIGKIEAEDLDVKELHSLAAGSYPMLSQVDPRTFVTLLGVLEVLLGGSLLTPLVRSRLAGLGLSGFAIGLLRLYLSSPAMRRSGSLRPSREGQALAEDLWILAIGMSLLLDEGKH